MLTRLRIRNFKKFKDVDIELGQAVVLIGPNNSGKTAALQALALWDIGRRRWTEKRGGKPLGKRPGATINRNDLLAIPVPVAKLLWRNLHVQDVRRVGEARKQETNPVFMDIIVEGITDGNQWRCGLEFYYANPESFYCRPLRTTDEESPQRPTVPPEAAEVRVGFLPPMSGLAEREFIKQQGEIGVLIGQGQTAQVLRNLCYQIYARAKGIGLPDSEIQVRDRPRTGRNDVPVVQDDWDALVGHIKRLFGVELLEPVYTAERSEITMSYREKNGVELDLSCAGRGLQQTLLLLAHLYANPRTVLLLDEPDAHLEILRQRQTYELLTETARLQGSQVVVASHSEVVLEEAADRDVVVAFVGAHPHRINDRGTQLQKALREIGFEQYYLAEEKGWVLYLEGSTDRAILQTFARTLGHEAARHLDERPFFYPVGNQPPKARAHFFGLREACCDLAGIAIFDRLDERLHTDTVLKEMMWKRRELENYLCTEAVLLAYARGEDASDLFSSREAEHRMEVMRSCIAEMTDALMKLKSVSPWSPDIKASDDFLEPLFKAYFKKLGVPNQMRKTYYHVLAHHVRKDDIDPEVVEKLDAIVEVAKQAKPAAE
jgi:energy-coupling factor transporter ATP-binding protein EcfA2